MTRYPDSLQALEADMASAPDTHVTWIVQTLIRRAKNYDIVRARNPGPNPRYPHIIRDAENPPDYTHETVLGAPWADDVEKPLEPGEQWNEGRRATSTGIRYTFNEKGYPQNPYFNTGINGRGALGRFGPNHAVDNGVIVIKKDEDGREALHAFGILAKGSHNAPAFAGGFTEFKKDASGIYIFDRAAVVQSQARELFEEMISGSIELLPEYEAQVQACVQDEFATRMQKRGLQGLSAVQQAEIKEQVQTALKLQQVNDLDPGFMERLESVLAGAHPCFAGPILKSNRNTNNAWIETQLSWFLLDDETWAHIKGKKPAFDYDFAAGDDAGGVGAFRIDSWLLENARGSHGSMFVFMMASFLIDAQKCAVTLSPEITAQAGEILEFLKEYDRLPVDVLMAEKPSVFVPG